jgi:hypothetical protein
MQVVFSIGPLRGYMTVFRGASECSAVEDSPVECWTVGSGREIIYMAKICYQETSNEDTAEDEPLWIAVTK